MFLPIRYNPIGKKNFSQKEGISMKKEQFDITGMTCSACSSRVEGCVVKLPGVKEVSVNLLKNSMVVSYNDRCRPAGTGGAHSRRI